MLQSFLPLFVMTFLICLFIVLMQFLWRFIDDLVGKGLGIEVIAELFFYAALTMIPMALPLAILLASLMTFGNLGEQFELTAMKAAGVSLLRSMMPLTVLMVFIAIGAFFFQNNVLPIAQTKMWTLLYSMRQKSPELEIPEGVFYDQIPGYNFFVAEKNKENGTLYEMMIYDISRGFENSSIILADSGRLAITPDKTHLYLKLWDGESFENLKDAAAGMKNVPYRRESFDVKEIMMRFDANFNRMDEQGMRNQYVGKNYAELRATIDSVSRTIDTLSHDYGTSLRNERFFNLSRTISIATDSGRRDVVRPDVIMTAPLNTDSIFRGANSEMTRTYLEQALSKARRMKQEYEYRSFTLQDDWKTVRKHGIELQKKFTLSFACIIFFFIGAPLGAIIRKGGLGMPLVISVFLFIFYYIIDNTGYKFARDGKWEVWQGMWLSAAVLLPLGIFLTYKAVNDSAVFNADAYANLFRKFFGINEVRKLEMKEVIMNEVEPAVAVERLDALKSSLNTFVTTQPLDPGYITYWTRGVDLSQLRSIRDRLEETVEYLSNSRNRNVILKLMDMPVIRVMALLQPGRPKWIGWIGAILFPLGIPVWLYGRRLTRGVKHELTTSVAVITQLTDFITSDE
ncbi:MAG: LptF/LptG family permease [Duncaniella sp.]|nr:LptF/LptG family permease [Duncaniella sp.]